MYIDEMKTSGDHLFRFRSYIPVLFLALLLVGMREFSYIGGDHTLDLMWEAICFSVSMFGLGIRAHIVGHTPARTSGRNTQHQVAEALNTTGLYSLVRHPLYVANFFMWLGVSMFLHDWRIVFMTTTLYWLYYERIMIAEEAFPKGLPLGAGRAMEEVHNLAWQVFRRHRWRVPVWLERRRILRVGSQGIREGGSFSSRGISLPNLR